MVLVREHRVATGLVALLLIAAGASLLGVGNDGEPWSWDAVAPRGEGLPQHRGGVLLVVLLPLGGLITASFRRFGVRTFGSFTPTLLALGLVGSPWTVWLLVFAVSLVTAITGRHLVKRLKVNRRARLSLVMMILAATTVAVVLLSERLGLGAPAGGVMLPMVALSVMVEHFHYDVSRKGVPHALRRLARTLLVALVSFGLFTTLLETEIAGYPAVALVVAAALILVGLPEAKTPAPHEGTSPPDVGRSDPSAVGSE